MRISFSQDDAKKLAEDKTFEPIAPGFYVVAIILYNLTPDRFEGHQVGFKVLSGTTEGQEGKQQREALFLSDRAMPKLQSLAYAAGLIKPGEDKDVDMEDCVGKVVVVEIEQSKKDPKYTQVKFTGFFSLDNPKVAHVPRPDNLAEYIGKDNAGGTADSSADDWGDF